MTQRNDGGTVYPRKPSQLDMGNGCIMQDQGSSGISLRDHFAIEILSKSLLGALSAGGKFDQSWEDLSEASYAAADAMLKEREK